MVKRPGQDEFDYKYLALDVKGLSCALLVLRQHFTDVSTGHPRVYLENADAVHEGSKNSGTRMFGVKWH